VSRKIIIQLLASLTILCSAVLPAYAAPQVNIVPLVQLLLLSPTEVTLISSGMQGIDSDGNPVAIGGPFYTDDKKVCLTSSLQFGPGTIHLKIEWFKGDTLWPPTRIDTSLVAGVPKIIVVTDCIIDSTIPRTAPASTDWKVILSTDGTTKVEETFVINPAAR